MLLENGDQIVEDFLYNWTGGHGEIGLGGALQPEDVHLGLAETCTEH